MKEENGHHHGHGHYHDDATLNPEHLKTLITYLKKHNQDHAEDLKKWHAQAIESGFNDIATEFGSIIRLTEEIDRHFILALRKTEKRG